MSPLPTLHRRTFLRGLGASLSLPFLEAMVPRAAWAAGAPPTPNRMAFIFFPNGAIMKDWTPEQAGTDYTLPKTLAPLEKHQKDFMVISGLAHDKARANGDGAGDHARCSAAFLTGVQPRKTDGADIRLGRSVDQVAADVIGKNTRLPSLEIGIEAGRQAGRCDSGYSCAYTSNISWRSETVPTAKEIHPKAVFERMFGGGVEDAKARARRNFYRQSILDVVTDDAAKLRTKLGGSDRRKLDEYFQSVREIEQRIERAAVESQAQIPDFEVPDGVPRDWAEHTRLMYDLMVLAFETDTTRICTFMLANSGSNRSYKEIGVGEGHHQLSHHRDDAEKIEKLQRIDQYMITQFSYFLDRMKSIEEGTGNLLDHSMITYGCAISDGNRHRHEDLPVLLAGRGNGTLTPGRHLKYENEVPMNNLYVSLLNRMDVPEKSFGDSTGPAKGLDA